MIRSWVAAAILQFVAAVAASQEKPAPNLEPDPYDGFNMYQYVYKNSLWDHRAGDGTLHTDSATWVHRLLRASEEPSTYAERSEFGFYPQWELPPRSSSGNEEAPGLAGTSGSSWTAMDRVNSLMFVPDNFDAYHVDPDAPNNIGAESYEDTIIRFIDSWEANAPNPDRTYVIYSAWTNLPDAAGGTPPVGFTDWTTWETETLGNYLDWFDLLLARVQTARPGVTVVRSRITEAILTARRDTALNTLPAEELFEDNVHGRPEWYLLIGAAYYMETFGRKVPSSFTPPAEADIHPVLTDNWGEITDYMWREINSPDAIAAPE